MSQRLYLKSCDWIYLLFNLLFYLRAVFIRDAEAVCRWC